MQKEWIFLQKKNSFKEKIFEICPKKPSKKQHSKIHQFRNENLGGTPKSKIKKSRLWNSQKFQISQNADSARNQLEC